jgi:hypothetical protein
VINGAHHFPNASAITQVIRVLQWGRDRLAAFEVTTIAPYTDETLGVKGGSSLQIVL